MGLVTAAKKSDLPPRKGLAKTVNGKQIALFNVDEKFFAIDDECTHAGGSLSEGELNGNVVTCPWHGATFDVTSGAVIGAPAFDSVKSYPVHVVGDEIQVEV